MEKKEITNINSADASEKNGLILKETSSGIEVLLSYATAKTVGIDPQDIITQINGTPIKTIQDLNTQLSKLKETEIAQITIKRNTTIITLPIGSKAAIKGYVSRN